MSGKYIPTGPAPGESAAAYAERELNDLSRALEEAKETVPLQVRHVAPTRPRDGVMVHADGSDFDPGAGPGPYARVDGSWVPLGGFRQIGTGATNRTQLDKLREIVSAKDFGAVGDGSTDDTPAIVAAVAACVSGGHTLYVPPGTYKTSSDIAITGNIDIVGVPGKSIIRPTNAVTTALTLVASGGVEINIYGLVIYGADAPTKTGIKIGNAGSISQRINLYTCTSFYFSGSGGIGVLVADIAGCNIADSLFYGNDTNVRCLASVFNLPTHVKFDNSIISVAAGTGADIQSGRNIRFSGCDIESNGERGIYIHPTFFVPSGVVYTPAHVVIEGCWIEDNWSGHVDQATSYSIDIDGTGTTREVDVFVRDCLFGPPGLFLQTNGASYVGIGCVEFGGNIQSNNIRIGGASTKVRVTDWDTAAQGAISTAFAVFNGATLENNVLVNGQMTGTFTPTVTASSGTITSYTASGTYTLTGDVLDCWILLTITNAGTATGWGIISNLPRTSAAASTGVAYESAATGYLYMVYAAASSNSCILRRYDAATPFNTGATFSIHLSFKVS